MSNLSLSIIIPSLGKPAALLSLLDFIVSDTRKISSEIIVCGFGLDSELESQIQKRGIQYVPSETRSRAQQMNLAARKSQGKILYFLHDDSYPASGFAESIVSAVSSGRSAGVLSLEYDWGHPWLKFNSWYKRFPFVSLRFGDQSLFVTRELFWELKGFKEDIPIMEDVEFCKRVSKHTRIYVLPERIVTSADKFRKYGILKTQLGYFVLSSLYLIGISHNRLLKVYEFWFRKGRV